MVIIGNYEIKVIRTRDNNGHYEINSGNYKIKVIITVITRYEVESGYYEIKGG